MKNKLIICLLLGSLSSVCQVSTETQIKQAVMAAPEADQQDCTVLGYTAAGKLEVIRKGTNKTICVADDPAKAGFNVACYHADLEPFMARGRELQSENRSFKEVFDIREAEAKSGKLKMPGSPVTLHILNGNTPEDANYRWVVYIPFATAESTGLPLKPIVPGAPWIMDPGTHRAHIMITPPPK